MAPSVFIVPGLWEGPSAFGPLKASLESAGVKVFVTSTLSTGTSSPGNPTMDDDIKKIHDDLSDTVEKTGADGVVVLLHSAAGGYGSTAIEGLAAVDRGKEGKVGGVVKIILFAAGVAPLGPVKMRMPFIEDHESEGNCTCKDVKDAMFHDLPDAEAEAWMAKMSVHPILEQWETALTYAPWETVPTSYIVCEQDRVMLLPYQEHFIQMIGCKSVKRLDAGHMAQLSATENVSKAVIELMNE